MRIVQGAVLVQHIMAVFYQTEGASFTYNTVVVLRIKRGGKFTFKAAWQFHIQQRMATLPITKCGSFTNNVVWQFYG